MRSSPYFFKNDSQFFAPRADPYGLQRTWDSAGIPEIICTLNKTHMQVECWQCERRPGKPRTVK